MEEEFAVAAAAFYGGVDGFGTKESGRVGLIDATAQRFLPNGFIANDTVASKMGLSDFELGLHQCHAPTRGRQPCGQFGPNVVKGDEAEVDDHGFRPR